MDKINGKTISAQFATNLKNYLINGYENCHTNLPQNNYVVGNERKRVGKGENRGVTMICRRASVMACRK